MEAAQTELESNKDVKEEVFCPQKFLQQPESFQLEFCGVFRVTLIALFNLPGTNISRTLPFNIVDLFPVEQICSS